MRGHLLAVAAAPVAVLLATLLLLLAQRGLAHGTGTDLPLVAVLTTPLLSTDECITALDLVAGTASANVTSCFTVRFAGKKKLTLIAENATLTVTSSARARRCAPPRARGKGVLRLLDKVRRWTDRPASIRRAERRD